MRKTPSEAYLEKARRLSKEETERLLSRMREKLTRRLEDKKLSALEVVAIQLEIEDEALSEWRERMQEIRKKQSPNNPFIVQPLAGANIGATPAPAFASNAPWPSKHAEAVPRSTPFRLMPRSTDLYWNRINPGLLSVVRTGDAVFCSIVRPAGAKGRNMPHACAASGRCTGFDRPAFFPSHYLCSTRSNF